MSIDLAMGMVCDYEAVKRLIGGGIHGHYLPTKNGRVLAALLDKKLNPDAPEVVLVGSGPIIVRSGELLAHQSDPIPVFLKQAVDKWRYEGAFQAVKKMTVDASEALGRAYGRTDVAFAIILERVDSAAGDKVYIEGECRQITSNRYERNIDARAECLKRFGAKCCVCNLNFKDEYGPRGLNFIHVHHLTPISKMGGPSLIDPVQGLRPVCPNCHSMLHAGRDLLTPEALKSIYWSEKSCLARQSRTKSKTES